MSSRLKKLLVGAAVAVTLGLGAVVTGVGMHNCVQRPEGLERKIAKIEEDNGPEKYALLVNGMPEPEAPWYVRNMDKAYRTLLKNGYKSDNIIVLDHYGELRPYPVDGAASKYNFKTVMGYFSVKLADNDVLVFYASDHGSLHEREDENGKTMQSEVVLYYNNNFQMFQDITLKKHPLSRNLSEYEMEKVMEKLDFNYSMFLFDACNQGGFPERIGKGKTIAASSTEKENRAYSQAEGKSFMFHVWDAWDKEYDPNGDGIASIGEAFDYASEHHYETKHGEPSNYDGEEPFVRPVPILKSDLDPYKHGL